MVSGARSLVTTALLCGLLCTVPGAAQAKAARGPAVQACDVARTYIRLTDEGRYDEVGDLWAPDAIFYNPRGDILRGQPAIKAFYSAFLRTITPVNRIGALAFDRQANVCVMEIETRVVRGPDGKWTPDPSGNFVRTAIDRFTVNRAGKIQEMRVYLAPDKAWLEE